MPQYAHTVVMCYIHKIHTQLVIFNVTRARQMFRGKADTNTIRRIADDDDSDDEEIATSKWEEPLIAKATSTTSQHNSITEKQTTSSNIKTGNKRPLPAQVS